MRFAIFAILIAILSTLPPAQSLYLTLSSAPNETLNLDEIRSIHFDTSRIIFDGPDKQYAFSSIRKIAFKPEIISRTEQAPTPASSLSAYPNPFNPAITIVLKGASSRQTTLTVYDLSGRKVATLLPRTLSPNHVTASWNGCDLFGRKVACSVYLLTVESGRATFKKKITLIK